VSGPGRSCAGAESAEHFLEVVLRVGGQGVPPAVDSDGSASRDRVVKLDVGRLRLVELHVPVAVRLDLLGQLLAEGDLSEGGAVRWEAACRECSGSWFGNDFERAMEGDRDTNRIRFWLVID